LKPSIGVRDHGITEVGGVDRVLNCIRSKKQSDDWTPEQALESGIIKDRKRLPRKLDLREDWWTIRDQQNTGACVGFATADGVLRRLFVKSGKIRKDELISPRFIWMANKEVDDLTDYPTTFIETAGTQTKTALRIARNFGAVTEEILPMNGRLFNGSVQGFYITAGRLRILSYHNLNLDSRQLKSWLVQRGPILARLDVDENFRNANASSSQLDNYDDLLIHGGHAVAIVGYDDDRFLIRNSWGTDWGDNGYAYVSSKYFERAFTEAYGVAV